MVEYVDSWFLQQYANVDVKEDATYNTESPAWAVDRFSILSLKVYHMKQEVEREDATPEHKAACQVKLDVLNQQHQDSPSVCA